jgi:hypothetical protein
MKLEESMVGEDSEPARMCSELAGTHFMIGKINSEKIPEFKRSGIGIIAEFRRILSRFPNQEDISCSHLLHMHGGQMPVEYCCIIPLSWGQRL